jgi:hypothetical protein
VADPTCHRFDPVPFVLGVVAVTSGLVVLAGGSLLDDAAVLFPAGLIALGLALLLRVRTRRDGAEQASAAVPAPAPGVGGATFTGAELYDLLVPDPTEAFLAEVAEREKAARPPDETPTARDPEPGDTPTEPDPEPDDPGDAPTEPDPGPDDATR